MGIKKVKQLLESCVLGTDLILGYGTMENIIGGGMGGPLGPNPNPSKTCEKNILKNLLDILWIQTLHIEELFQHKEEPKYYTSSWEGSFMLPMISNPSSCSFSFIDSQM